MRVSLEFPRRAGAEGPTLKGGCFRLCISTSLSVSVPIFQFMHHCVSPTSSSCTCSGNRAQRT